jgi:hypothetical protein
MSSLLLFSGIIAAQARFKVTVNRSSNVAHGFRIESRILMRPASPNQEQAMVAWCQTNRVEYKPIIRVKEHIKIILEEMDVCEEFLTDRRGYLRMKYVMENPKPRRGRPFTDFIEWATAWDDFNQSLDI